MQVLGIYGSGGHGREVAEIAREMISAWPVASFSRLGFRRFSKVVFIDDVNPVGERNGIPAMSFERFCSNFGPESSGLVLGVGEPASRLALINRVAGAGYRFSTVVHPSAQIPESATIGDGSVVSYGVRIGPNVSIGTNALLQPFANLSHDCLLGENVVMSAFCTLGGNVSVGANAFLGMSASVRERRAVGEGAVVGMGSAVVADVPPNAVVAGVPARILKKSAGRIFE